MELPSGKLVFINVPGYEAPLPVELPPGIGEDEEFDREKLIDNLTEEMILSGILRGLSEIPAETAPHRDYYRSLAESLRPNLLAELAGAAVFKARNGDAKTALEILGLLEGLYPEHPSLAANRAAILEEQDAETIGENEANKADESKLMEAARLLEAGKADEAILLAKKFLEIHPASANGWLVLGQGLKKLGRADDAAACFGKASELGMGTE